MTSLFSSNNQVKYLKIIYNDEVYTGNIENLFDNKEFNSLSVCTFVSSIKYFFNKVNDFDKIELLLGMEDGENAQNCRYFSSKIWRYKKHTNDFIPDIIRKKAKDIFIINLKNRGRIFLWIK